MLHVFDRARELIRLHGDFIFDAQGWDNGARVAKLGEFQLEQGKVKGGEQLRIIVGGRRHIATLWDARKDEGYSADTTYLPQSEIEKLLAIPLLA